MNNPTGFYAFYNRALRPEIARVESLRRHTMTQACLIGAATVMATAVWIMLGVRLFGMSKAVVYSGIVPIGVGMAIWGPIWQKYRDAYQLKLIAAIVRLYNESFSYGRDDAVGEVAFTDCGLFPNYLDHNDRHYRGTDRIAGRIGDTAFEFSDIDVSVNSGKSRAPIFAGVFFVADFNKNFSGATYVTSRYSLQHPLSIFKTPPGEVVTLEDPEFEDMFATHSTGQIEARYILSPALMSRIVHFGRHCKNPVAIAFSGTSMFIALPSASTRLEPVLWQTLRKPSLFFGIWANLEFLCGIVNEMDLNTRIWTKAAPAAERLPA